MVILSPTDLITIASIVGAALAGWALREFTIINKAHDDLCKNVESYVSTNNENITDVKVNIAQIQTSIKNIEGLIKRGPR